MFRMIETERTVIDRKRIMACDNCGTESPNGDVLPDFWYSIEHRGWGLSVPAMHACTDVCVVELFGAVIVPELQ